MITVSGPFDQVYLFFKWTSPGKHHPSSWVRARQGVLFTAVMWCNLEQKTSLCHPQQCMVGQDLNHTTHNNRIPMVINTQQIHLCLGSGCSWKPGENMLTKKHTGLTIIMCTVMPLLVLQRQLAVWNDTLERLDGSTAWFSLNEQRQNKGEPFLRQ